MNQQAIDDALVALDAAHDGDGPWLPSATSATWQWRQSRAADALTIVCPKWGILEKWVLAAVGVPTHWNILGSHTLLSAEQIRRLRDDLPGSTKSLLFLGDLKPRHLAIYWSLLRGGVDVQMSDEPPLDVRYVGIDDSWLELCQRHARSDQVLRRSPAPRDGGHRLSGESYRPTPGHHWVATEIEASAIEMDGLRLLETMDVDWDAVVGPRCMEVVRSGWTLHLEGASNPACFAEGFSRRLAEHLLDVIG